MNRYKVQAILEYIRQAGGLPRDPYGQILPAQDIIGWFCLDEVLSAAELHQVRRELQILVEIETMIDKVKLAPFSF